MGECGVNGEEGFLDPREIVGQFIMEVGGFKVGE